MPEDQATPASASESPDNPMSPPRPPAAPASPPASTPAAPPATGRPHQRSEEGFRIIFEQILIAFILAFIFRAFVLEAFGERDPLYRQWADAVMECGSEPAEAIADRVVEWVLGSMSRISNEKRPPEGDLQYPR